VRAYIDARGVTVTFRPPNRDPVTALGGLDLEVGRGEFVSLVGPSGCGKERHSTRMFLPNRPVPRELVGPARA